MIVESIDECKRLKQIIGLIQSSTMPPLKGIDAFSIHNTCEWLFDLCVKFEQLENERLSKIKVPNLDEPIISPKKTRKK